MSHSLGLPMSAEIAEVSHPTPVSRDDIERLWNLQIAFVVSRSMAAVTDLGIADALGEAPLTPAELAGKLGLNAKALGRVLKGLATQGVFEDVDGRFRHTALSRLLRADHPQSRKDFMSLNTVSWPFWGALDHALKTGRPAAEAVAPAGLWEYFRSHPDLARTFDRGMASKARTDIAALMAAYDFSGFHSLADVGGGRGHLLRAILDVVPAATGILLDLPQVIDSMRDQPHGRMTLIGGDFFKDRLPACDAYLLMHVIHDWDEDHAVSILGNVRKAASQHAKLLLIEMLLPETLPPGEASFGAMGWDLSMLVWASGEERTRGEYERLLKSSGWRLERVVPTETHMSVLEAIPA